MDVVIIANFCGDFTQSDNNRFRYLAKMLSKEHEVELITSDFLHSAKKKRGAVSEPPLCITQILEPGYPRNICFRRFYSHWILSKNINQYLRSRKKPDIIYCAVPSLDVGYVVAAFCNKNKIRFVVDIQDLWPEAFKMVFDVPVLSNLILWPMKRKADFIYKMADKVIAVSDTYAQRVSKVNKKAIPEVVFLGTDRGIFDSFVQKKAIKSDVIEIVYIGSLEKSYDLENVIRAVSLCHHVRLVIIGDGSKRELLQQMASEYEIDCEFTGRIPYSDMVTRMSQCDIAVNPIKKGSAGSVINKVCDYAMAGLPVVNTQECEEYCNLLVQYHAGLNCRCEDAQDIANKLKLLIEDSSLREQMAKNSRRLGEEKFDRSKTYQQICYTIKNM